MCIICIELIKHRMSIGEGVRAAGEIFSTQQKVKAALHNARLKKALENLDFETLAELLDEAEKELDSKSKP